MNEIKENNWKLNQCYIDINKNRRVKKTYGIWRRGIRRRGEEEFKSSEEEERENDGNEDRVWHYTTYSCNTRPGPTSSSSPSNRHCCSSLKSFFNGRFNFCVLGFFVTDLRRKCGFLSRKRVRTEKWEWRKVRWIIV